MGWPPTHGTWCRAGAGRPGVRYEKSRSVTVPTPGATRFTAACAGGVAPQLTTGLSTSGTRSASGFLRHLPSEAAAPMALLFSTVSTDHQAVFPAALAPP